MTEPVPSLRRIDAPEDGPALQADTRRPQLTWLPIDRLRIDDAYQRPLGRRNWEAIRKIAAEFRWERFTPILAAPTIDPNLYAVIDGQHRVHAAAARGITEVPAMVVRIGPREQASAFAWVNGQVTAMTQHNIYRAGLAAGERWALRCRNAVSRAGCTLMTYNKSSAQKQAGEVYCVALIRKLIARDLDALVTRGLTAICTADQAGDFFLYTNTVLDPFFDVLTDPVFDRVDLVPFLRAQNLAGVLDRVDILRQNEPYRSQSRRVVARDAIRALLADHARQAAPAARVA